MRPVSQERPWPLVQKAERAQGITPGHHDWCKCSVSKVLFVFYHLCSQTPLNNNIRELFNLMNFLDPNEWGDLERLEKDHKELTEDLVKELHNRLRPYFLRRLKGQVLQLPPKVRCCRRLECKSMSDP